MTDRPAVLGIDEEDRGEHLPGRHLGLLPALPLVFGMENVATVADGYQTFASVDDILQQAVYGLGGLDGSPRVLFTHVVSVDIRQKPVESLPDNRQSKPRAWMKLFLPFHCCVAAYAGTAVKARTESTLHSESALASGEWTRSADLCAVVGVRPDWVRRMTGSLIYLPPFLL